MVAVRIFSHTSSLTLPGGADLPGGHHGPVPEAVGLARLQTAPRWLGRPGPSHAPPGMQGCSWELSKSVTFPLESEVTQPPRPGPAFLMGIQHKQGARGQGKLRGPSAPPSDGPKLSFPVGRRCLMPEIPHWAGGCKYQGSAIWETPCRSPIATAANGSSTGIFRGTKGRFILIRFVNQQT